MSNIKFNRVYLLEVGAPVSFSDIPKGTLVDIDSAIDKKSNVVNKYTFTENNIKFNIKKNNKEDSNQGVFQLYNVNLDFISFLNATQGEKLSIRFSAGYYPPGGVPNLSQLFSGTLSYFNDTFEGEDRVTELACDQGAVQMREATSNRSYPAGTKIDTIVDDLIKDLKVTKAGVQSAGNDAVLQTSRTFNGPTAQLLKGISSEFRMNFTIDDDNTIMMLEKDKRIREANIPLVAPSTGLIGDIEAWDDNADTKPKDKKKVKTGYSLKMLLSGSFKINTTVAVESRTLNMGKRTELKVEKIEHEGELYGDSWYTKLFLSSGSKKVDVSTSGGAEPESPSAKKKPVIATEKIPGVNVPIIVAPR